MCVCMFLRASDNPASVAPFSLIRLSPSIQLAVESLINVNSKSMPYEVKWGLIIENQCSKSKTRRFRGRGNEGCFPLKMAVG